MWPVVIILILASSIARFIFLQNREIKRVKIQKRFQYKYRQLINSLMSGDPRSRIFHESYDSITLGVSSNSGSTKFILTQLKDKLSIQWKCESNIFGKQKLKWIFEENFDQKAMVERIINESYDYSIRVM